MIRSALSIIAPKIKQLAFVHRYGGPAKTVTRSIAVNEDFNIFENQKFPVTSDTSVSECWEDGRYLQLCPNDRYASVVFFEEVNGMSFDGYSEQRSGRRRFPVFSGQARLVAWLNYQELGLDETEYSDMFALSFIGAINSEYTQIKSPLIFNRLQFSVSNVEPQSSNPFSKYSFSDIERLLLYPYGYVSMIVDIQAELSPKCFDGVDVLNPIECVEY